MIHPEGGRTEIEHDLSEPDTGRTGHGLEARNIDPPGPGSVVGV